MTRAQAVKWYILLFLTHFCCLINFIHPAAEFVNTLIGFSRRKSHRKNSSPKAPFSHRAGIISFETSGPVHRLFTVKLL